MIVEIWTEAEKFPEKEYINGIFLAVHTLTYLVEVAVHMPQLEAVQYGSVAPVLILHVFFHKFFLFFCNLSTSW